MHDELIDLGLQFKGRREEKRISLREVENATSIRINHLRAIEEGKLGELISPIYAQGFLKKYASFLELDGEKMLSQYPTVERYLYQERPGDYPFLSSIEVRPGHSEEKKWARPLLWVGGSVLASLFLWFSLRALGLF